MLQTSPPKNPLAEAKKIFVKEVNERLPEAQKALSILTTSGFNSQACTTLYKFAHTLKGSGQTVSLWDIADSAAEMAVALLLVQNYGVQLDIGLQNFLTERMENIIVGASEMQFNDEISLEKVVTNTEYKKILVVDDDPTVTKLIQEGLEKEGFKVIVCHDILTAEKQIKVEQPDLLILDVILPSGDGIEFCRKIRSCQYLQIVPIIFLTVKSKLQDKLAGFATGADDYLCKPFQIEELTARIQAILNRVKTYQHLVLQDDLTGVYNRRYLGQRLEEEIAEIKKSGYNCSLAMVDIDFFKSINDQYGHIVGDEVLQVLVKKMSENLRNSDVICRYGGEEFSIILPDTEQSIAYKVLERLQHKLATEPLELSKSKTKITVTVSIGVVGLSGEGISSEELLKAADDAMYQAKAAGRNKIFLFKEMEG